MEPTSCRARDKLSPLAQQYWRAGLLVPPSTAVDCVFRHEPPPDKRLAPGLHPDP